MIERSSADPGLHRPTLGYITEEQIKKGTGLMACPLERTDAEI
jgi:hypothetical protein